MHDMKYTKSKLCFAYAELFSALAANRDILITTPAANVNTFFGAVLEASAIVASTGSAELRLFESTTVSANGTPIVLANRMRLDTPPNSTITVFGAPTVTGAGTQLYTAVSVSAVVAETDRWILKPATNYLLRLVPTSTPSGVIQMGLCQIPNFDYLYKGSAY